MQKPKAADPVAAAAAVVVVAAAAAAGVLSGPILWGLRGMQICFRPERRATPCGSAPPFRNQSHCRG